MLKRSVLVVFSCLFFVFFFLSFKSSAFAQTVNPQTLQNASGLQYATPNTNPDVPKDLHTYSQSVMIDVLSSAACMLGGYDPVNPSQKCLGVDQTTGKIGFVQDGGGAYSVVAHMMASLYDIPAHTSDYFNDLAGNFGITKKAYAVANPNACNPALRGIGFCGIYPLLDIWSAFRNFAYFIYVLVFIGVGLAVMLRVKIDPRTVMTIENSLPRLVISLILVTFSFAISGFLIDLMYVSMYATQSIAQNIAAHSTPSFNLGNANIETFQSNTPMEAASTLAPNNSGLYAYVGTIAYQLRPVVQKMLNIGCDSTNSAGDILSCGYTVLNPFAVGFDLVQGGAQAIRSKFDPSSIPDNSTRPSPADWLIDTLSSVAGLGAGLKIATVNIPTTVPGLDAIVSGGKLVAATAGAYAAFAGTELFLRVFAPYLLIYLVLFIAVMWAMFRLWFELVKAYIFILIDIIFSPFWMLSVAIPGEGRGFGAWLRDIVANLSAFPVTIGMFFMGKLFIGVFPTTNSTPIFLPPLIANFSNNTTVVGAIISVGIILLTPQVVLMMKSFLKAPEF